VPTQRATTTLTGWGRTAPSVADVVVASSRDVAELAAVVKELPARGGIARGLGRSYGDPAQNGGGVVIRLEDHVADPTSTTPPERRRCPPASASTRSSP
jgi:hypothetical protein